MPILSCNCTKDKLGNPDAANYQDRVYGRGMRVHTQGAKDATCTVCGDKKATGGGKKEDKKEDAKSADKGKK